MDRIFISSVMSGYNDRRDAARRVITGLGMHPVLAEGLPSDPNPPRAVVRDMLLDCDAMVGIYGQRYGWRDSVSGLSPTEEEFRWAQETWIPVFAFIDRMESGQPEPHQRDFLETLQNWDRGVTRNEFYSLDELADRVRQALTGNARSPRYQRFLSRLPGCANTQHFRETLNTRLPNLDLVLHREPRTQFEPGTLIATVDGDSFDQEQVAAISRDWQQAISTYFQTGFLRAKHATGFLVVAVERNPNGWRQSWLNKDQYLVDLASASVYKKPVPGWRKPWAPDAVQAIFDCALQAQT